MKVIGTLSPNPCAAESCSQLCQQGLHQWAFWSLLLVPATGHISLSLPITQDLQ